jgi:hypothetical protein
VPAGGVARIANSQWIGTGDQAIAGRGIVGSPALPHARRAGAENPLGGDEEFEVYLRAKADADAVQASDLDWTILSPGGLTEDVGTGSVRIGGKLFSGQVPRGDRRGSSAFCSPIGARWLGPLPELGSTPIDEALDDMLS